MNDTTLFGLMMDLPAPWELAEVLPNVAEQTVTLKIRPSHGGHSSCYLCGKGAILQGYDEAELDAPWTVMRFKAQLLFQILRNFCRSHGSITPPLLPAQSEVEQRHRERRFKSANTLRSVS